MNTFRVLASIAILAAAAAGGAAVGQSVNLDGSVDATAAARAGKRPTLASTAASSLASANVPSVKTDPADLKAVAEADMRKRDGRPRLTAQRENLKGDDAKRAIAERQNPSTYDRDIQNGDIDHTDQVTDLKLTLKK
jgi:hypothetical protein